MKLGNPVKDFKCSLYPQGDVTQWYGENVALYSKICPAPNMCMTGGHNGIDIVRPWGTPLLAVDDGIVVDVKESTTGYGKHVRFISPDGFEFTYGHLSEIKVVLGQHLKKGDVVGLMGNTGFVVSGSTPFWKSNPYAGTHLHLGVRKVTRVTDLMSPASLTYLSGTPDMYRCNVDNYDNGAFGFLPLTAEDFWDETPTAPTPVSSKELTIQSLLNSAVQLEAQGKASQAAIVRAVAGVVQAFWN